LAEKKSTLTITMLNPPAYNPVLIHCWHDKAFGIALLLPLPFWWLFHAQGWQSAANVWMLLLVSPLLEELAFRGTLQGLLLQSRWGVIRHGLISHANLLTAALFGLTHALLLGHSLALLTFFPGLLFGFFRERYQTLWPVIALHSYYNAGLLL